MAVDKMSLRRAEANLVKHRSSHERSSTATLLRVVARTLDSSAFGVELTRYVIIHAHQFREPARVLLYLGTITDGQRRLVEGGD